MIKREYRLKISRHGDKYYFYHNCYHRVWGPAMDLMDGCKFYLHLGKSHRLDGPSDIWFGKRKVYCVDGANIAEEDFYENYYQKND